MENSVMPDQLSSTKDALLKLTIISHLDFSENRSMVTVLLHIFVKTKTVFSKWGKIQLCIKHCSLLKVEKLL